MDKLFFLIFFFAILLTTRACRGSLSSAPGEESFVGAEGDISRDTDTSNFDNLPFRLLPLSEQLKRSELYHAYDEIKLKRYDPMPTYYSFRDEEEGYMVIENFPGVLHYRYLPFQGRLRQPYTCYKLEFYDPQTKRLRRRIDLIKESPYNEERYPIVGYSYPATEDFSWADWAGLYPAGEKAFYDLLNGHEKCYLTVNNVNARPNGFTIVEYQLIEMSKAGGPFGWEETLVVFDSLGHETGCLVLPNDTQDAWTSDDGRFLAFIYGGAGSCNPEDYNEGGVKIYDFEEERIVFHKTNKDENGWFMGIAGAISYGVKNLPGDDLLVISLHKKEANIKWIVDFPTRQVCRLELPESDTTGDCPPAYEFSTYRQALQDCTCEFEKF